MRRLVSGFTRCLPTFTSSSISLPTMVGYKAWLALARMFHLTSLLCESEGHLSSTRIWAYAFAFCVVEYTGGCYKHWCSRVTCRTFSIGLSYVNSSSVICYKRIFLLFLTAFLIFFLNRLWLWFYSTGTNEYLVTVACSCELWRQQPTYSASEYG